jgi:hypothetical protein
MIDSIPNLPQNLPTPVNDIQYVIYALAFSVVAIWLGTTFIKAKYGGKKVKEEDEVEEERRTAGQTAGQNQSSYNQEICKMHQHRTEEVQAQLNSVVDRFEASFRHLQGDINNQAIETEKAFHKLFRELMTELKQEMDSRDKRLIDQMDLKLSTFKEVFVRQATDTFRPLVESAVSQALTRRRNDIEQGG